MVMLNQQRSRKHYSILLNLAQPTEMVQSKEGELGGGIVFYSFNVYEIEGTNQYISGS